MLATYQDIGFANIAQPYPKYIGMINPIWFDYTVHDQLETLSCDK